MINFLRKLSSSEMFFVALVTVLAPLSAFFAVLDNGFGLTVIVWLHLENKKKIATKIFLLTPKHNDNYTQAKKDDIDLIKGVCKKETQINNEFEIIEYTDKADASKQIAKKTKQGYRYFVSFFSDESKLIAENWDSYKPSNKENPILICAVTSSKDLITEKNKIYRFYIRSEDEAKCLARRCHKDSSLSIENVTSFYEGTSYGSSAETTFKNQWKGKNHNFIDGVAYNKGDDMSTKVSELSQKIKDQVQPAIFIALYGEDIKNFITAWKNSASSCEKLKTVKLIFTSTFMNYTWIKDVINQIKEYDIITCLPEKRDNERYWNGTDVDNLKDKNIIEDFIQETIKKVKYAVGKSEKTDKFHLHWLDSRDGRDKFEYYVLPNADSKIFLDSYCFEKGNYIEYK